MQNSEAFQAWIQGRMATFRFLVLVSKTEIRSMEFSFSSRSLKICNQQNFSKHFFQIDHQIWWFTKCVTKFGDELVTKFGDKLVAKFVTKFAPKFITKFGDSLNSSPNLVINWSPNSVIHRICHQIWWQIRHQIWWITKFSDEFVTKFVTKYLGNLYEFWGV